MAVVREEILIGSKADTRGFKKAQTAAERLNRSVKSLAKTVGLAYGAGTIAAYGKAAVKAFSDDEAAAARLATAVDNLGLSFSKANVEAFIKQTETSSGILDDELRPAMQALLTTTGSLTKSQQLLNKSIQISRASGIDLATVSQDLANGYVGITKGLKKYNTGLTQAELKSKSFNEVLGIMLAKSANAANDYLGTTAYKLDVLNVAAANAQETIGAGLVDAFAKISGGSSATDAAKTINNIAESINAVTSAAGLAIGAVVKLYKGLDFLTSFGGLTGANGSLATMLEKKPSTNRSKSPAGTYARTQQQSAAEKAAAKRAADLNAALLKLTKNNTAELKKQAALKKAGTVFDLEQIQIIAALKGKLSEEEKIRLQAQLAILNENEALASSLTKQILMAQDSTGGLYKFFLAIGDMKIKNPFAFLDEWILEFQKKLNALKFPTFDPNAPAGGNNGSKKPPVVDPSTNPFGFPIGSKGGIGTTSIQPTVSSNLAIQDTFNAVMIDALAAGNNYTQSAIQALSSARYEALAQSYGMGGSTGGTAQLELKITGDGDLTNAIASSLQQSSLSSGNQTYINRRTGGFE